MKNHPSTYYRNAPGGSGINSNTKGQMIPVALEDMIATGSRTQRRWALKEMRKIAREKLRQQRKSTGRPT